MSSRSRTPGSAITCAGRLPTTRVLTRPRAGHCSWRSIAASARSGSTSRPSRASRCCCGSPATPTCCSSHSDPACSIGSASDTSDCARRTPDSSYCAITGYGQDGPNRDRSGHDMNYLGLNGLLGLTGDADGPPVQAAGQIADIGGGALMGVIGVLIALRERERSGEGQLVDCSMFDGALSWLAMVAADAFASGRAARRGELQLAGSLTCYRPYQCADGYVTLGRARAEVLERVLSRRRPRGPARPRIRSARLRRAHSRHGDLLAAHPGAMAPIRFGERLLSGAGARSRRGTGVGSGGRP